MPITLNEIAEQCKVSRTTVIRALNNQGRVGKETKEKILAVAKANNYRPNLLARSLNNGKTMSIGVVTLNVENMFFVQSLNIINKEADKRGYFANIAVCEESVDWEKKLIQGFAERQMEGILISPINRGEEFENFLLDLNIPVVCIGNKVSDKITNIQVRECDAAKDAVRLIASKGYKRIIFVCPPLGAKENINIYTHEQRKQGFDACKSEFHDIRFETIGTTDYLAAIEEKLKKGLKEKTAFLCSGDIYALNIMRWCENHPYSIPNDFGLMGFDNISMLQYMHPKLTTVSTNLEGVAKTAVNELIQQIESEDYSTKSVYLNYEILDRETL